MSPEQWIGLALIVLAALALALSIRDWWRNEDAKLDRIIADALDEPDLEANVAAYESLPKRVVL